ncbi:camk camkl kin4 kinase [Fusarium beomiforme]|uniref:Camk camkl kin4 kinase n=1 Tax=Fusarium beomiforme TaxID=44412 RepID=A0A9P5DZR1_9HYPO|nr:camk camkl kin4 kinase [Fusarium beomiforme]
MSDPLSTAASVVGLLTAAAQISKILTYIIKKARNAPNECKRIKSEVDDIQNVLQSLQLFLIGTQRASSSRTSLILVEQVVATLAACVITFSELETLVLSLETDVEMNLLDKLQWTRKDSDIKALLDRLESHKSSLTLMLVILTCQSQEDAESKVDRLCLLVEQSLAQNRALRERLAEIGESSTGTRLSLPSIISRNERRLISQPDRQSFDSQRKRQRNIQGFAFEEVLLSSRAYRFNAKRNSEALSVVSSAGKTGSWSRLSGLSLSEISHIALQAIPIYTGDISNERYYPFSLPKSVVQLVKPDPKKGPYVFGVALEMSIGYANVPVIVHNEMVRGRIPTIIAVLGEFLRERG